MNKTQLIDALAERFEGNRKLAAHALESVLDTITREVERGEKVAITGFGSFEKRIREARWVRNPRTGDRIQAARTAVPKFTAGADLKNIISGAKALPEVVLAAVPGLGSSRSTSRASTSTPARKTAAKASTAKKSAAKKSTAEKAPAAAKATTAKKASTAKTAAKKAPAAAKATTAKKTSTAKRATAKKTPAKKSTAKSTTAKKAPAKKA